MKADILLSGTFVLVLISGFATPVAFAGSCVSPGPDMDCDADGFTPNQGDCDDNRSDIFPGQGCELPPAPPSNLVAGEIIPIETTSLILAGAQSFSWMIPVLVAALGIAVVIARKF